MVVAKVLGIPKASLGNWVRPSVKGKLDSAGGIDKSIQISPEPMEIARLGTENARPRMERDIAKKPQRTSRRTHCEVHLDSPASHGGRGWRPAIGPNSYNHKTSSGEKVVPDPTSLHPEGARARHRAGLLYGAGLSTSLAAISQFAMPLPMPKQCQQRSPGQCPPGQAQGAHQRSQLQRQPKAPQQAWSAQQSQPQGVDGGAAALTFIFFHGAGKK